MLGDNLSNFVNIDFVTASSPEELKNILLNGNYKIIPADHTIIAAETPYCKINLYKSGTCLIQGEEAEDFVKYVLETNVLKQPSLGYEDILNPEGIQPHIGVDESGKGDFFGPMIIASAYVDPHLAHAMREMDVRDSKKITSDDKIFEMGKSLRKLLANRFSIVRIGPEAYNRLYIKMRSVNAILAWAHARAIENILATVPDCPRAVSDQFGNARQVQKALMEKGKKIELIQRHKAESDLAVAAASILAREEFLLSLKKMSQNYNIKIPKGVSQSVKNTAINLIKQKGPKILIELSKCHFKTTDEVLASTGFTRQDLGPLGSVKSKPIRKFTKKTSQ